MVDLYARCFGDAPGAVRAHVASILAAPARRVQVAWLGAGPREPIGVITALALEDAGEIVGFGVVPERRGHGYGRRILVLAMQGILASGEGTDVETLAKRAYDIGLRTLKECEARAERKPAT